MTITCFRSPSAIKVRKVSTGVTGSAALYCESGRGRRPCLVERASAANLVDFDERLAQPFDPVGLMHPDQAHAPRERLAPAPRHPAGDECVEDRALAHPQPGHDGDAEGRADLHLVPAPCAPGDLPAEVSLAVELDRDPVLVRFLPKTVD